MAFVTLLDTAGTKRMMIPWNSIRNEMMQGGPDADALIIELDSTGTVEPRFFASANRRRGEGGPRLVGRESDCG